MRKQDCLIVPNLFVLAALLLGVSFSDSPAADKKKPPGSFRIPAWTFDRGNARIYEHPDMYADYRDIYPELVAGDGGGEYYLVEYDIDFPVDATYTVHIRYVAGTPRPLELFLDDQLVGVCCETATASTNPHAYLTKNPYFKPQENRPVRNGAQWTEAATLAVTKGKHVLKLTRKGPGPNLSFLKLDSSKELPPDWKMDLPGYSPQRKKDQDVDEEPFAVWPSAGHMAKINRLPPEYRTAFLAPGHVNTATIRLALEDMITDFGQDFPRGQENLKNLDRLVREQEGKRNVPSEQRKAVGRALSTLRHRVMRDHPLLDFERLLFVKRISMTSSHIYSDHWDGSGNMGGNLCVLSPVKPDGKVTELVPELNGGLFGRFDLSFDAKKVLFSYKKSKDEGYRLYEIDLDPSTGLRADGTELRQLTFDDPEEAILIKENGWNYRFEDCDPCYLPSGRIMFASTRSKRRVFCFGSTVTSLYVMDADGGNLRCVSNGPINEMSPCVMDDGRVIYTRWEYVDKGFGNVQSLWSMRPNGSHSSLVYKNDVVLPAGMINARSIPGSNRIVTVGAPHCGLSVGPVILVDNQLDRLSHLAMKNITPELGYPAMSPHPSGRTYGYFKDPYPLSEKFFLVAHNPFARDREPKGYGLYLLDAWGNKTEIYRDPEISCFQPMPLIPRPTPTVIEDSPYPSGEQGLATLFMQDVYQGMTGIERGKVKYLRVMDAIGTSWDDGWRSNKQNDGAGLQASAVSLKGDVNIKKILGIATVHEDGSAYFTVPAEKNLFFQALDENFMELQRMKTFVNLMPGEKRSCIGCHQNHQTAPSQASGQPLALKHPAATLRPQPGDSGPRSVHYAVDIRPILDKHCIGCHGSENSKGDLDLTGELTKLYDVSYENFINKGLVANLNDGYGASNLVPEPPMSFGSHQSRLVRRIREAPCRANLSREELIRIVTWVDANAPYFGTHRGKKNLKWKDDPDFRPLPPSARYTER